MGFLKLFKNIGRAADAKADEGAQAIESANLVAFGKQDIEKMKTDIRTIKGNIGSIKAEVAILEDKIKNIQSTIKKHEDDAIALMEADQEDLAEQHASAIGSLEEQITTLTEALRNQNDILADQIKNKNELASAIQQAEADLVSIKAMDDAAKANQNLAQISTTSGTSALAAFKERKEAAKKNFIKSKAMKEDDSVESSLNDATAAALGTSEGKSRLAALMANKKSTSES